MALALLFVLALVPAYAPWSTLSSGYAIWTDYHGIEVPVGTVVTATAGTTEHPDSSAHNDYPDVTHVKFRWMAPNGSETFSALKPLTWDGTTYYDGWPVYTANDTLAVDAVGGWGVQAWFYDAEGILRNETGLEKIRVNTRELVDWWPMFHHDPGHTGYSTSTAPNTNNTIWNYTTGNWVASSPAVADGKVYVGSWDCKVYCLDASTGAHIWSYTTGSCVYSSPAVADGKVYVGSCDCKVYCLDASTGTHVWSYTTGDYVTSSPAVADGKVYIGSDDNKVYCLDALTGAHVWNYTPGSDLYSSPAVADGKVYVGSLFNGKVYCLRSSDGHKVWEFATDVVEGGSSPAVADGKVYIGSSDNKVHCLNASTGAHVWSYTTGGGVDSSPAVADGKVYVGSWDCKVYCLDALTGTHVWNYTIGIGCCGVRSSPAVADGKVYIGSCGNKVHCLNASTGAHVWSYTTGSCVYSSPAVADGKVYIGGDNKVYCFGSLMRTRDVALVNVSCSKTVVCRGFSMNISVTVENQGDVAETFNVTVYANATDITILTVNSLLNGTGATLTFTWNTTGFAKGNYTINAVADTIPGETDTVDNNFTDGCVIVSIVGDITGPEDPLGSGKKPPDGVVDMRDVGLVARYFGETVPPAPAICDLTGPTYSVPDGQIDMRDVGLVARHFGETDP